MFRRAALTLAVLPLLLLGLPAPAGASTSATSDLRVGVTPRLGVSVAGTSRAAKVRRALRVATNQIGDPYKYGAAGPDAFDCSGLVYFSTHRAGFGKVPRTSAAQAKFMRRIKRARMRPGDFVFFTGGKGVYHVGVFAGRSDGERVIVHAPNSGSKVRRSPIWTDSWFPGTLRGK